MNKIARIFLITLALCAFTKIVYAQQNKAEQQYQQALYEMEGKGDYTKAIASFNTVLTKFPKEKITAAKALLNIGRCYEKLGKNEALKAYERILIEFKDQTQIVAEARTRLAILKQPDDVGQTKPLNRQIFTGAIKFQDISAPSPDGRFLSYSDNYKNVLGIYDTKTEESKILSDHYLFRDSIWVEESIWSPDGKQLAYEFNDWTYHTEIHLVNADGTGHRVLCSKTDTAATYINFYVKDWSPDGKFILATYCHGSKSTVGAEQIVTSELLVISVDNGSIRVVKKFDGWGWGDTSKMFFSPDNRLIAFSYPKEKNSKICEVFVISIDGSNETNITQHPSDDRVLGWEPNGNRLLFQSDRGGTNNLWATQIVNGKPQGFPKRIQNNIAKVSSMGMTNDGSLYYYLAGTESLSNDFTTESNVYFAAMDPSTGKILSQPKPATMNNNGFNHSHSWSPDGKQLLYLSYLGKNQSKPKKSFILNPKTGSEREVKHQLGADSSLGGSSWFPDGKNLATNFYRMPNRENGIYKLEVETGRMIPLIISKDTMLYAQKVSPDGKTLFFNSSFGGIYSFELDSKKRKVLFQQGKDQYLRNSVLSPDGKYLAFALVTYEPKYSIDMMIMPSSGGEPKSIFKTDVIEFFSRSRGIKWSWDGKYIYFAKESERNSKIELLHISVHEGSLESTGFAFEGLHDFFFSPDGKEIAFCAAAQPERNIWVMENVFADARTQPATVSGPVTRRVFADASNIGDVLTADGKYIRSIGGNTGDVKQFEIATGDTTSIKNKSNWGENEKNNIDRFIYSYDGKKLVYSIAVFDSVTKKRGYELRIRNLDGTELRTFYHGNEDDVFPFDWSPDGQIILVARTQNKVFELTLISIKDGSQRTLKSKTIDYIGLWIAKFSPDGKFIAFSSVRKSDSPNSDILIINIENGNEFFIAEHLAEDQMLRWTPDGKNIVFLSDRSGTWDLWAVQIAEGKQLGEPQLLKKDFGYNVWDVFGFTPDGSFYYTTGSSSGGLYFGSVNLETGKLIESPRLGKTRYNSLIVHPSWSPDGKKMMYISNRNSIGPGNNIITIRSAENGEEHFLTPPLRFVNQISWTPDSRSILAIGITTQMENGIFSINSETSETVKLAELGFIPKLCPDGKTLVFISESKNIIKHNLESGEESVVVKGKTEFFDLSPDGKEVVYYIKGSSIMIQSLSGGEPREIFKGPERPLWYYGMQWTRDGKYIIVWEFLSETSKILLVPAKGGTSLQLDLSVPKITEFAIHPDNKQFAYSIYLEPKNELWVMENFLPKEVPEDKAFKIKKVSDFGNEGSVSPDGKYLSYVDWETGNGGELAIYEIATENKSLLTNSGPSSEGFPLYSRWSPDSKQLVYDWYDESGHVTLNIVGIDESKPRVLYNNKEVLWAQTYGWSPDGKQIPAIFYKKANYQIVLVSTLDGSVRDLKTLGSGWPDLNMCFSPDSRYIVYDFQQKEDSPERDITILPIDGTNEISLVKHPANDYVLGWAPDGKNILFASDRGNNLGAWVIQFYDGKVQGIPKLVKANIGLVYPMGFTLKGSFYYGINDKMQEISVAEIDSETNRKLTPPKKLSTHFEGSLTQPSYSPDGKYITYIQRILYNDVLCIHSLEIGHERYFSPKLKIIQQPLWSPDGRSILFGGWDLVGKKGIYRMDVQSGIFTLIVPPAKESSEMFVAGFELTRDGQSIILVRISNNLSQIMLRNLESGTERELYRESHRTSIHLSCSPDGKWLAFMQMVEDRVLKVIPTTGGEPKELYKFKKEDNTRTFKWALDGKNILFKKFQPQENNYYIWRISMEGGEPQKVGLASDYPIYGSIHPDGKHIVFSSPVSTGENSGNWVMENFLPKEKK